ncbi:hypothetical protein FVEN_g3770 [Fusarium venenatum]|uniref:DUF7908 domain-containing protein n=1 Tax=Fusarium venenatum TaxID=56646 RepID=A0A2L2SU83_9HYPO|nr:uncharacterized protein FVRRES_13742 [Fusarium venenatum]KAG8358518.1 hypothetical protein FVEN_g3770 [Fusarium venenatum]KAH6980250.1 hypothetical protein EDB82DRAFT_560173 [Fusarium venenatum]CEI41786.1 unnamed protein product [Fusarium venenatum]
MSNAQIYSAQPPAEVGNSASEISDTALAEYTSTGSASYLIHDFSTATKNDNPGTSNLPTSSVTINPAHPGVNSRPVIFRIVNDTQNTRRGLTRRDLGGFVGSTQEVCAGASVFNPSNGRLLQGTAPVFYAGESFKELRGQAESLPQNAITTTFAEVGGSLRFRNSALPNGEANFCQTPKNDQTYITFTSSSPGCIAVRWSIPRTVTRCHLRAQLDQRCLPITTGCSDIIGRLCANPIQLVFRLHSTTTYRRDSASKGHIENKLPNSEPFFRWVYQQKNKSPPLSPPSLSNCPLPISFLLCQLLPKQPNSLSTHPRQWISFPIVSQSSLSQVTSEETSSGSSVSEVRTSLETSLETSIIISESTTIIGSEVSSTTVPDSTSSFNVESTSFGASAESSTVETTITTSAPTRACSDYFILEPTTLFDDSATADENEELPSDSISSVAVCPYWDDLRIKPNAGHDTTYQIIDSPDLRAVSVEWCGLDSNDVLACFVVRF